MPRRASSGPKPALIVGVVALLVAAFFGGKLLLGGRSAASDLDGAPLDMAQVEENANALRGNSYVVNGKVDGKLTWTVDRGQLISLQVGQDATPKFLGIEIPANLSDINIERGRDYAFRVRFRDGGIAVAEEIQPL
ncbi:hypothetical protein [Haloferula sargassicola]|uniref:Uncharacterized protein n=1 Tax=Haloferula sargassicola TaxID=490096 RepID=A0ABP9UKZ7_9BACT